MNDRNEIQPHIPGDSYAPLPSLRVRYYAGAAQAAGKDEAVVTVTPAMTLSQAAQAGSSKPLETLLGVCSFLVDGRLRPGETVVSTIAQARRLDVLPPFAGG